ncbi:MAG: Fpg/Nei family DNA glycosylase [Dehalococcoidia bacterium]|nr:Fpg/Nei family DNA glycosylase [Dehalococcoidia bacterium]
MPEAPELEVVKGFLIDRAVGASVEAARVLRPSVLRSMAGDFEDDILGRAIEDVRRAGKFLTLSMSGARLLVVNPMLTGGFQWSEPSDRVFKRTCFTMTLSNGRELRYIDERQMGRVYYVSPDQVGQIPQYAEMGPDALDEPLSLGEFKERLRPFRGEIKGIITRGRVIAGIGNAYVDEILWEAEIYPFRKKRDLSDDDLQRILNASSKVMSGAVGQVREAMGGDIHRKRREFLKVHNRGGEPCPRCGAAISQLTANQRITSYCRTCQPGLLLRR